MSGHCETVEPVMYTGVAPAGATERSYDVQRDLSPTAVDAGVDRLRWYYSANAMKTWRQVPINLTDTANVHGGNTKVWYGSYYRPRSFQERGIREASYVYDKRNVNVHGQH